MTNKLFFNRFLEKVAYLLHRNLINYNNRLKLKGVVSGNNSTFSEQSRIQNLSGKRENIKIGDNTFIRGELLLFAHGGNIAIGNWCYVGENSKIWSAKKITIGNYVLISHNVNIHDNNAHSLDADKRKKQYEEILTIGHPKEGEQYLNEKEIVIHDHVWIGFNAIILKGVTIGEGAVIAAGSLVTKDVEPWTVVAGNPAKVIRYLPEYKNT